MPELLPHEAALDRLNKWRMSDYKRKPVYQWLLEHNEEAEALTHLPSHIALGKVPAMTAKYADVVMTDTRFREEYEELQRLYDASKAPERQAPDHIMQEFFPQTIDEHNYYTQKDEGRMEFGWGDTPE